MRLQLFGQFPLELRAAQECREFSKTTDKTKIHRCLLHRENFLNRPHLR